MDRRPPAPPLSRRTTYVEVKPVFPAAGNETVLVLQEATNEKFYLIRWRGTLHRNDPDGKYPWRFLVGGKLLAVMLVGRMGLLSLNVSPLFHCLRAAGLHTSLSGSSIGRYKKLKKRKDSLAGYPPEFRAKLQKWPKLLQAEIDESVSHLKQLREVNELSDLEERGLLLANLRLVSDELHPLTGRTVVLRRVFLDHHKSDRSKIFRAGTPATVRDAKTLKEIAECVMLISDRKNVKIKIRRSSASAHLNCDTEYILTLSQSSGALHSVKDFFLENKVVGTAGVDLLGYAFRAKMMPSVHNDRMIAELASDLNDDQRRAVSAALNKRRPFVTIQGPPGTGKTRVVAEIVKQLYIRKLKTLVCAPSNVAVDKAMSEVIKLFTTGNYEDYPTCEINDMITNGETIEEAISSHDMYPVLCDMFNKINNSTEEVGRAALKTEANKLKWKIIKDSYKKRLVVFCTLTSSAIQRLAQVNWHPDVIIIDEAAQASEPIAWAAIVQANRCVLAGDHAQLPCTVLSTAAREGNLQVSLMERLANEFSNHNINQLLTVQYRMNEKIMQWSSKEFYESRLVASDDVAKITLSDISFVADTSKMNSPLMMINTDLGGQNDNRLYNEVSFQMSYRNPGEADLVIRYVRILKSVGVSDKEIAVISPYYAQVTAIRDRMNSNDVSVNTVDSFQGQEREVVVFSMVRCNPDRTIGFLQDERRLNVAITRAKRQFVLIGSARMMQKNRHLRSLLRTIQDVGKICGPAIIGILEKEVSMMPTHSSRQKVSNGKE
ncbi:DNA-binding protein SMUBP-2 [Parelaphostrongylus tenuis]|uniref:DNA-binding protein SMUBP-2 n=1 Tax=Parelaphostrongylus tenuis TaxID=148309 RepID=A0AAD5RBL5_PARTN|nr:DNA-binding protein SMUBP-2 [Parelaphostrongylus tenuis]